MFSIVGNYLPLTDLQRIQSHRYNLETAIQHGRQIVQAWLDANFGEGFEPDWQEFLRGGCEAIRAIEDENMK